MKDKEIKIFNYTGFVIISIFMFMVIKNITNILFKYLSIYDWKVFVGHCITYNIYTIFICVVIYILKKYFEILIKNNTLIK